MLLVPPKNVFNLQEYDKLIQHLDSQDQPTTLIFLSSHDPQTGRMWCPDCVRMETVLTELMTKTTSLSIERLTYVYVGQRDEWRSPTNEFRLDPWNVQRIPTVIKVAPRGPGPKPIDLRIPTLHDRLIEDDANDEEKLLAYIAK